MRTEVKNRFVSSRLVDVTSKYVPNTNMYALLAFATMSNTKRSSRPVAGSLEENDVIFEGRPDVVVTTVFNIVPLIPLPKASVARSKFPVGKVKS